MKNNENKKRDYFTNIIDSYITEKLLVDKASENDNLRFPNINSGVTTNRMKRTEITKRKQQQRE